MYCLHIHKTWGFVSFWINRPDEKQTPTECTVHVPRIGSGRVHVVFFNFVCVPTHMSDTWYEEVDQEDVLLTTSSTGRYFVTYVTCTYVINMFIQSINDTAGGVGCVYLNQ